jgi:hypothetical protein
VKYFFNDPSFRSGGWPDATGMRVGETNSSKSQQIMFGHLFQGFISSRKQQVKQCRDLAYLLRS